MKLKCYWDPEFLRANAYKLAFAGVIVEKESIKFQSFGRNVKEVAPMLYLSANDNPIKAATVIDNEFKNHIAADMSINMTRYRQILKLAGDIEKMDVGDIMMAKIADRFFARGDLALCRPLYIREARIEKDKKKIIIVAVNDISIELDIFETITEEEIDKQINDLEFLSKQVVLETARK